jgi:hypothetical protein
MEEWAYAQAKRSEKLARLHVFSVSKQQDGKEIEFVITVKEFATPPMGGCASSRWPTNRRIRNRRRTSPPAGAKHF